MSQQRMVLQVAKEAILQIEASLLNCASNLFLQGEITVIY